MGDLFLPDSHWRDIFGISWQLATFSGREPLCKALCRRAAEVHHLVGALFGADVAERVGRVWGFDDHTQELRNMWTRTGQPGLWFTGGAFSQCRIYSRYIALQIDAIEAGRLPK